MFPRWNPALGSTSSVSKDRCLFNVGVWDCRSSLQCSDTANRCLSIQATEGEMVGGWGASSGERRSRGGSWMSQTWTQRFLRLNKRQRISLHSGSDAKTFSEPRMASSLGLQWQLCHLLVFLKSIHTAGGLRERDFYKVSVFDLVLIVIVFSICILICICFNCPIIACTTLLFFVVFFFRFLVSRQIRCTPCFPWLFSHRVVRITFRF